MKEDGFPGRAPPTKPQDNPAYLSRGTLEGMKSSGTLPKAALLIGLIISNGSQEGSPYQPLAAQLNSGAASADLQFRDWQVIQDRSHFSALDECSSAQVTHSWVIPDFKVSQRGLALDRRGNLLMLGLTQAQFTLKKFNAAGQSDFHFAQGGTLKLSSPQTPVIYQTVKMDSRGRIIVAGTVRTSVQPSATLVSIQRFLPSGQPDLTFGESGQVHLGEDGSLVLAQVAIDRNDRLLLLTNASSPSSFHLARLRENGQPDQNFNNQVNAALPKNSFELGRDLVLDQQGRILLALQDIDQPDVLILSRLQPTGVRDATFGDGQDVHIRFTQRVQLNAMTLDQRGRLVMVGTESPADAAPDVIVVRTATDGKLDQQFGTGGHSLFDFEGNPDFGQSVLSTTSGQLMVGIYSNSTFGTLRLFANGTLDETFAEQGLLPGNTTAGEPMGVSGVMPGPDQQVIIYGSAGQETTVRVLRPSCPDV